MKNVLCKSFLSLITEKKDCVGRTVDFHDKVGKNTYGFTNVIIMHLWLAFHQPCFLIFSAMVYLYTAFSPSYNVDGLSIAMLIHEILEHQASLIKSTHPTNMLAIWDIKHSLDDIIGNGMCEYLKVLFNILFGMES